MGQARKMERVKSLRKHLIAANASRVLVPKEVEKMSLEEIRERFGKPRKDSLKIDGVNVNSTILTRGFLSLPFVLFVFFLACCFCVF